MEKWQLEIKRLDKLRLDLGLNMSQMQKRTGIDRSRLKSFFEFKNIPSIKFYFEVRDFLEKEIEVKVAEVVAPEFPKHRKDDAKKRVSFREAANLQMESLKVPKEKFGREKPIESVSDMGIIGKQICDCKLENGLLKRGKIKCKKTKEEHNF